LITRWMMLDGSHGTGSEHQVIEWEFTVNKHEEENHLPVIGWKLPAVSNEDEEAAVKLLSELERERAQLGEECRGDDAE
jgi:hypothetical protein